MKRQNIRFAGRVLGIGLALFTTTAVSAATAASAGAPPSVVSGNVTRLVGTFMSKASPVAFALPQGGTVRFFADTEASFLTDPQKLMLLPGKKTTTYSIMLRKGRVEVELPEQSPPKVAVAVSTSSDTRIVTLTGRMALNARGRDVSVVAYSGLTTVTQGTKLQRVPLSVKRLYFGKVGLETRELLPATTWAAGRRVWLATNGSAIVKGYGWAPVAGAREYSVSLHASDSGKVIATALSATPSFETDGIELLPGRYELKVAAIDSEGFLSPSTRSIVISVVGVSLPPGAALRKDGSIALGADQQVSLTNAEGLTVTTADHRTNVPATASIGLAGQERASILIHAPGGGDPSTLSLVRREPLVVAWAGPKFVTWPMDPVELEVSLKDERGNPLHPSVEPTPRVMVGVEPVAVDWLKDGNRWRAKLPARTGRGPWVVRLEIIDQYGIVIGRDFVEVATTQPVRKRGQSAEPSLPLGDETAF